MSDRRYNDRRWPDVIGQSNIEDDGASYDYACETLRGAMLSAVTLLVVIEGKLGTGFSLAVDDQTMLPELPGMLRRLADCIERET